MFEPNSPDSCQRGLLTADEANDRLLAEIDVLTTVVAELRSQRSSQDAGPVVDASIALAERGLRALNAVARSAAAYGPAAPR
jgi:hypothetical protein